VADLRTLHPGLIPWAKWLYAVGKFNDPLLVVTSAYRSPQHQTKLYNRWISGQSKIPAAPPGRSLHQYRLAFDMARIGKDPLSDHLLNQLGALWESYGGKWGGVRDPVHFQVRI